MGETTHITEVNTVIAPMADQNQALAFYVETLGCEKHLDGDTPARRWIEVAPTGRDDHRARRRPTGQRTREPHNHRRQHGSCRSEGQRS